GARGRLPARRAGVRGVGRRSRAGIGAHPAGRTRRALHRAGAGPAAVRHLPVGQPLGLRRAGAGGSRLGCQQRGRRHDGLAGRGPADDLRIRPALCGLTPQVRVSGMAERGVVRIRDARAEEFGRIGGLRAAAYRADGFLSETSTYADTLRVLGMDGTGEILAAVDGEHILGTVTLVTWPNGGEVRLNPGEGEVRALAVARAARGRGIGRALLGAGLRGGPPPPG